MELFYFDVHTVHEGVPSLGWSSLVKRAVDEGLDLFAGQRDLRSNLCRGLGFGSRVFRRKLCQGLGWRGWWFCLLGLGRLRLGRLGLGRGFRHLTFDLRSLGYHESCFLSCHLQDLELLGGPFLAASGFVSVGVGHLT
jgi:hypothetical protein